MSEVIRSDNGENVVRYDDEREEFFTSEEYDLTGYQDASDVESAHFDEKKLKERGAKANNAIKMDEHDAKEGLKKNGT